jgi:hypothetical protein
MNHPVNGGAYPARAVDTTTSDVALARTPSREFNNRADIYFLHL